jgi:hypothetical protein
MDIAFGDCLSIGGFCYALILVDRTTRYNWTFGLKMLTFCLDKLLQTTYFGLFSTVIYSNPT